MIVLLSEVWAGGVVVVVRLRFGYLMWLLDVGLLVVGVFVDMGWLHVGFWCWVGCGLVAGVGLLTCCICDLVSLLVMTSGFGCLWFWGFLDGDGLG